jgi:hypothetical protein
MLHMLFLNVAEFCSILHEHELMLRHDFFPCCNVAKVDLDVADVIFECCEFSFTMLHATCRDEIFSTFLFLALQADVMSIRCI